MAKLFVIIPNIKYEKNGSVKEMDANKTTPPTFGVGY